MGAELFQIGVFGQPSEIAVAEFDSVVEGRERTIEFIGEGVAAREVVKHERVFRLQSGETFVHMQAFGETAALGVVIAEELQGVHVIGIAADKALDELDFGIEVALFRGGQFFLGAAFGWHTADGFFPTGRSKSSGR